MFINCLRIRFLIPLMPHRRKPIDAALFPVAHAVAADAGVVPVGDEDAAVRGDADVARPEPVVRAGHHVLLLKVVAGAGRRRRAAVGPSTSSAAACPRRSTCRSASRRTYAAPSARRQAAPRASAS